MLHPLHARSMDGVFVVFYDIRVNTNLVEPIYCLEEEKRASLIVFLQTEGEDGEWT